MPTLPVVDVPAVALAVLLRVDAGQDVGEKGRLLEDVVDPLQLRELHVVLEGERVEGVTE